MEEKHGAFWSGPYGGWQPVYERYDLATDQVAMVLTKNNLYKAVVFCKRSDSQWRLPLWSERASESLLASEAEAIAYVEAEISHSGSA